MRERLTRLLDELLVTHAPSAMEQEMDAAVFKHLREIGSPVQQDPHGNISLTIPGRTKRQGHLTTLVTAHKDELGVMVHRIDRDGKMWVEPLGGCRPGKYGEGPFDLVTPNGVIEGVLCMGSMHSSEMSPRIHKVKTQVMNWDVVYLDCKLSAEQLKKRGVTVGERAVIGRRRKQPMYIGKDYVGGYALDDKAAVAVLLLLAAQLKKTPPLYDVCIGITACEEGGVSGGAYMAQHLDPLDFIAVEVAPIAEEYPIAMDKRPVVYFKDAVYHYSPDLCRELIAAGGRVGVECQPSVVRSFGSDASGALKAGLNGRSACLGFPTENTHGFEIGHLGAMEACVRLLARHLVHGPSAPASA
ncbi:MAG: hypothetical protein A3K19_01015 [Lentisphaerae bacterium RIFOXYB12_FULL_65_16]|nr:MAG: hypothetical protein A3K18_34495 [Lentisphaerae bacterium RIFOXYA12_64_32]OGV90101.1 MAG: hypothetical protein A3K19_01015 [Lentisphaerae bacterium RIFOXYB12_FULL_65_16]